MARRRQMLTVDCKINVVPVINVSLVVVLTLMMIAPFLTGEEIDVDLPEATASQADDTDNIEILYTSDRRIVVAETVLALEELPAILDEMFRMLPHGVAVVKADQGLPYREVEALIAVIDAAGAPRIALATRPRENQR
ncbi:MAG: biopolymer transporter ExbD [Candidatus Krumholzibacteria bacterium]|nr:biopolymer transporter ExbD [Candidatus Krumholzibacteria bacterium]